jgi:hypothetical protein
VTDKRWNNARDHTPANEAAPRRLLGAGTRRRPLSVTASVVRGAPWGWGIALPSDRTWREQGTPRARKSATRQRRRS